MIFITGPLYSGKRAYACQVLGCSMDALADRAVWDVQELARGCGDLEALADRLAEQDAGEREAREAAGRLSCLLARRADRVVRVFCGLPLALKGETP